MYGDTEFDGIVDNLLPLPPFYHNIVEVGQ